MLIDLKNLKRIYRVGDIGIPALNGISLSIKPGEFVAIMGASGSGKSTLLNILGCLDRPTSGEYWLENKEVSRLSNNDLARTRNQRIGFIFQNFNLLPRTSALENAELPLYYGHHMPGVERRKKAAVLLARLGLADRLHHHPNQLSGGQQQRVAIARALINQPPLILADEPTGNLDSHSSAEIMALFQQLNREGITIVMVTHENDIAAYAQRSIHMRDGEIVV